VTLHNLTFFATLKDFPIFSFFLKNLYFYHPLLVFITIEHKKLTLMKERPEDKIRKEKIAIKKLDESIIIIIPR